MVFYAVTCSVAKCILICITRHEKTILLLVNLLEKSADLQHLAVILLIKNAIETPVE
jgi:hypothetical protein